MKSALNWPNGTPSPMRVDHPYGHAEHATRCRLAAEKNVVLQQFVQVQMNHVPVCARIVAAWDTSDRVQMWQLDLLGPIRGRLSMPTRRVRQCSGVDGLCACAGEKLAASEPAPPAADAGFSALSSETGFFQAGVVAPPESPDFGNSTGSRWAYE